MSTPTVPDPPDPPDATVIDATAEDDTPTPPAAAGVDLVPHYAPGRTELIVAATPDERIAQAAAIATSLASVIEQTGARTKVGTTKKVMPDGTEQWVPKYHVNVEGWQTLATLLGVALVERHVRPITDPVSGVPIVREFTAKRTTRNRNKGTETVVEIPVTNGHDWEAVVDAVKDGVVIATGSGMCSRTETAWVERDEYAVRAMASTRATSRAMRQAAAWIVLLAGYSTTPAEEMPPQPDEHAAAAPLPAWAQMVADDAQKVALLDNLEALSGATRGDIKFALRAMSEAWGGIPVAVVATVQTAVSLRAAAEPATATEDPEREAESDGNPEPERERGPLPGSIPLPDLTGVAGPVNQSAALRKAGCTCDRPLHPDHRDTCPLTDHGIAF